MPDDSQRPPFGFALLAAAYLFFLLLTLASYGHPFPLMGTIYGGRAGEWLVFADALCSLYLLLGIVKRQRLTAWLIIGYNLFDIVNALVNLALIPQEAWARLADAPVSQDALRFNTLAASLLLLVICRYVYRNRRHFSNLSPYLF